MGKNLPAAQETQVQPLVRQDALEKEMAAQSSILVRKNLMDIGAWWAAVMGSQRVGHDWATNTLTYNKQLPSFSFLPWSGEMHSQARTQVTGKKFMEFGSFHLGLFIK